MDKVASKKIAQELGIPTPDLECGRPHRAALPTDTVCSQTNR